MTRLSEAFPNSKVFAVLTTFLLGISSLSGTASLQDLGLQQVVEMKQKSWGGKAGYQFRLIGRSSPFFNDEPIPDKAKSLVMMNSVFLNGQLGSHWMGTGIVKYSAGLAFTRTNHLEDLIDWIDHDSQTAFLEAAYFTPGNWITRAGIRGSRLITVEDGEEQFSEMAPMFSVAKVFRPRKNQYLSVRWLTDYSNTDSLEIAGTGWTDDRLNHWSTGLQFQHTWLFPKEWTFESYGSAQYNQYSKGINKDREDTALSIGSALDWEFFRYFSIGGYAEFLKRNSTNGTYSFSNWDGGLRFKANLVF